MKILVRQEIIDVLEDCNPDYKMYFINLFVESDTNDYPNVNFNVDNCKVVDVDDSEIINYLKFKTIDTDDILLVSTLLCDGFIKTMRDYSDTLKTLILDK